MKVEFDKAFFIKLGGQGKWEQSSIEENKLRIGWAQQSLLDINAKNWETLSHQIGEEMNDKGAATRDFNALKNIVLSTPEDIWVTFYSSHLWWCRVDDKEIQMDSESKYKTLSKEWSCEDVDSNPMMISNISGKLSKTQGFRGTVCKINEFAYLKRLINNQPSDEFLDIKSNKNKLIKSVSEGIKLLHWSDFETLIDILFSSAGWHRMSAVGKTQKFIDMEYREPITGKFYQVQVKSSSGINEFLEYSNNFNNERYEKLYFIVHSPQQNLKNHSNNNPQVEFANGHVK